MKILRLLEKKTMQNEEEIKEIKKELADELNSRNELLSSARDFHFDKLISFGRDYTNYVIKLGELSFLIGGAITPIVIVSGNSVQYPKFVFSAIALYLFNGILAIWKSKDIIERQLDAFAPGNLHALEKKVQPLQFLANKIIFEFKDEDIKEYMKQKRDFISNNAEEKVSTSINVLLDALVFIFVLASLLIVRAVWTFSITSYWHFFGIAISLIMAMIIAGAFRAKAVAKLNAKNTEELNKMKLDFAKWREEKITENVK